MGFIYISTATKSNEHVITFALIKCLSQITTYLSQITITNNLAVSIDVSMCTGNSTIYIKGLLLTNGQHNEISSSSVIAINFIAVCEKIPKNNNASALIKFNNCKITNFDTESDLISIKTRQNIATSSVINSLSVHLHNCTFSNIMSNKIILSSPFTGSLYKPATSILLINTTFTEIRVQGPVLFTRINNNYGSLLKSILVYFKFKYYVEFLFIDSYALLETKFITLNKNTILFSSNKFTV